MKLQFRGIHIHDIHFVYSENYQESQVNMGGGEMDKRIWIGGAQIKPETLGMNTGFRDGYGNKIFEGDVLREFVDTEKGVVQSLRQVFWNKREGAWHIDESLKQNKSESSPLARELRRFKYEYAGNIYQSKEMLNYTCND